MTKVSICIPSYNQERIIRDTIESAISQEYEDKEILLIDDCSSDNTYNIAKLYPIRSLVNDKNLGFTGNFNRIISEAKGEYIIFLCGDDVFTNTKVVHDAVKILEENPQVAVVSRYYYQYLDGQSGAVMTLRNNLFILCCQPSGVAIRKSAIETKVGDKIFTEIPNLVKDIISKGWGFRIIKYDTIAARLHPGELGNAATCSKYYMTNPQQSIVKNWTDVLDEPFIYSFGLIQVKNRFPKILLSEIITSIKLKPSCLFNIGFVFCAIIALIMPQFILRNLSNFYRHRISRSFSKIIRREEWLS